MVTRPHASPRRARERAVITAELVVAMAILALAILPLAFSFVHEQRFARACYHRAVAMEILDGEMEALAAGEWKAFQPGEQDFPIRAGAAKNLPAGRFLLTMAPPKLRLEWIPVAQGQGGRVIREAEVRP